MSYVFVYGTLKKGQPNHNFMNMAVATLVGPAITTSPIYDMTSLGAFPAMLENGNYRVLGEVYHVEDLSPLDDLEGHPHFYKRKLIPCTVYGMQYSCWTYFLPKEEGIEVSDKGILCQFEQHKVLTLPREWAYDCDWYLSQTKEWQGVSRLSQAS